MSAAIKEDFNKGAYVAAVAAQSRTEKEDVFEEMYQALLDAPVPLDQSTLYADWYRMVRRPAVKDAQRFRKARG